MVETNGNGRTLLDSAFVRVMTLIVSLLLIPIIGWTVMRIDNNSEAIGELRTELPLRTSSRYTADDARRDQDRANDRMTEDERRIAALEARK